MRIEHPIKLYVDQQQAMVDDSTKSTNWLQGADAVILDPCYCTPGQFESMPVEEAILLNGDPQRDQCWRELSAQWVCGQGIEATARLRDLHPELRWIPRLRVTRDQVSYRFSGPAVGEGFSFYMPDTAAINGWQGDGMSLDKVFDRVTSLGFADLWLHSPAAAIRCRGLDLDLLDKTKDVEWAVWLSGGVDSADHLHNLLRAGGASVVVVDATVAQTCTLTALAAALVEKATKPEAVPMTFTPRKSKQGVH